MALEQKAPVSKIVGYLLECPSDESTNPGAAQQLQTLLSEKGLDLNAAYGALDADGSGSITHQEFRDGLRGLGIDLPNTQIREIIAVFDEDGDGEIEYREFIREFGAKPEELESTLARLQSKLVAVDADFTAADLTSAFAALDFDGDGSITHDEFRSGLRRIGIQLPVTTVEQLIKAFDEVRLSRGPAGGVRPAASRSHSDRSMPTPRAGGWWRAGQRRRDRLQRVPAGVWDEAPPAARDAEGARAGQHEGVRHRQCLSLVFSPPFFAKTMTFLAVFQGVRGAGQGRGRQHLAR